MWCTWCMKVNKMGAPTRVGRGRCEWIAELWQCNRVVSGISNVSKGKTTRGDEDVA